MATEQRAGNQSVHQGGTGGGTTLPSQESIDCLTMLLREFHRRTTPTAEELPPDVKRDVDAVATIVEAIQNALALRPSAMTVTKLDRTHGSPDGGTAVVITGTRFLPGSTVLFGKNLAPTVFVASQSEIQVTTPRGPGVVDVVVNTLAGTARLAQAFTYKPEVP